jgi:hypothetical protein
MLAAIEGRTAAEAERAQDNPRPGQGEELETNVRLSDATIADFAQ